MTLHFMFYLGTKWMLTEYSCLTEGQSSFLKGRLIVSKNNKKLK